MPSWRNNREQRPHREHRRQCEQSEHRGHLQIGHVADDPVAPQVFDPAEVRLALVSLESKPISAR